jgi:hypothetical protein
MVIKIARVQVLGVAVIGKTLQKRRLPDPGGANDDLQVDGLFSFLFVFVRNHSIRCPQLPMNPRVV